MKPWMKALIWLGLGSGIGFFAGYQVGSRENASKWHKKAPNRRPEPIVEETDASQLEAAEEAMKAYSGDTDGDEFVNVSVIDSLPDGWENESYNVDDDDDPEEFTTRGSECDDSCDIPQLHPEDLTPYPITEDEFNLNEKSYDLKGLDFYEYDEVLYDPETNEVIGMSDELLGIGWDIGFGGDPNNPNEVIYICNDTMGTLYRIALIHGAFQDLVVDVAPEEEKGAEQIDEDENW